MAIPSTCDGTPQPWTAQVSASTEATQLVDRFRVGQADVSVSVVLCGPVCVFRSVETVLMLDARMK